MYSYADAQNENNELLMRCGPKREVWYRKVQLCAFAIKVAIKTPYAPKKKNL